MLIFLGLDRSRGGGGPTLFRYNKLTDQVTNAGPLFDPASPLSFHSGEGWYFSGTQPTKIYLNSDSRMLRYDVLTHQLETVFDVAPQYGSDKYIWQMHSSDDDRVHSATLRTNPTYEMLGCVVYKEDTRQFSYFPKLGDFDECHVDKSGRWLVILDNVDRLYDVEMRIIDLTTNTERMVWDQDGAAAHLDTGYGYLVGGDNWNRLPNAELLWDFTKDPLSGSMVWHTLDWSAAAPNHIAHGNARPGVPAAQQYACGSGASRVDAPWANEIICFPLDGSLRVLVVAPVMTDLNAPGGGDDYTKFPKATLDVTGQYFIWASNRGGSRLDAFMVKVPSQVLMGGASDTTAPSVSITAPTAASTVAGTITVSESATDNVAVAGVQLRVDGANLGAEDTASPYSVSWNTTTAANGSHILTAVARDAAGNVTTSAGVTVTVANDTTPPSASITAPAGGASVSATATVTASATDHVGVVGVQPKLAGASLGAEDTTSPYSVSWNTTTAANGRHVLTATARDAAGNATTSAAVSGTVANGVVVTLAPQDTFINLDATNYSTNAQLLTYTWPDNQAANAILMKFDLSAIPPAAVVSDATLQLALVGNDAAPETTYTITAHKVTGKSAVIAAATGFTADGVTPWTPNACCSGGVPLAEADISAAYDTRAIDKTLGYKSWSITAMAQEWVANGTTNFGLLLNSDTSKLSDRYRIFASMENADPTLRPFLRITYALVPDVTPPAVSITAPTAGATVLDTVTVTASATDNVGVVGVQFKLDGANLGPEDTAVPYSQSWNTPTATNGSHTLTAVARDAAGNTAPAARVTVTAHNPPCSAW